jgi:hypothetical protein
VGKRLPDSYGLLRGRLGEWRPPFRVRSQSLTPHRPCPAARRASASPSGPRSSSAKPIRRKPYRSTSTVAAVSLPPRTCRLSRRSGHRCLSPQHLPRLHGVPRRGQRGAGAIGAGEKDRAATGPAVIPGDPPAPDEARLVRAVGGLAPGAGPLDRRGLSRHDRRRADPPDRRSRSSRTASLR